LIQPKKQARSVSPGGLKKKPRKRIEARHAWEPAQRKLAFPVVGGIALVAIIALILVVRRKK
jgi:hypothetical protein